MIVGEGSEGLGGELVPSLAARVDDGVLAIEQAVGEEPLAQEQLDASRGDQLGRIERHEGCEGEQHLRCQKRFVPGSTMRPWAKPDGQPGHLTL